MKSKRLYKQTLIIILLLICFNCENELDIEPAQGISPQVALGSEANVLNLLVGTYAEMAHQSSFGGNSQIITDLLGSSFNMVSWNGTFVEPREFFLKGISVSNLFVEEHWNLGYEIINQANLVIDYLDVITSSVESRQKAEGEAKFLRALAYFDLVRNYGLPYEPSGNNSQLGVPLSLVGNIDFSGDLSVSRNSVREVYNQIISDLNDAYNLLPTTNSVFADKYAVKALLSRIYLQQGNYSEARDAAHDVIENSGHALVPSFDKAFNNDVDSSEDVFAIQFTVQDDTNFLIYFYASQANGGRFGDIAVEQGYLDFFDDPINDERASFFYISENNGQLLTAKYTNQYGNIAYIRLAEIHLIRAECNLRLNTAVGMDPLDEVNTIRNRAGASSLSLLTLDLILNERKLELGFEGFFIHDIKRTQNSIEGLPYNDNRLVLPIPQAEMDSNSLMEQNPGYGN